MRRSTMVVPVLCTLFAILVLGGCVLRNESSIEGKLVDWRNKPAAGIRITATLVKPTEGYTNKGVVTGQDGTFRILGLHPSSEYTIRPVSDVWTCKTVVKVRAAPRGELKTLPPTMIRAAASKQWGVPVFDLTTGETQFSKSKDGVITDSKTGLAWVVGPDRDMNYAQAKKWSASCKVAGGGWRLPTRSEISTVFRPSDDNKTLVPVFGTNGIFFWTEQWMDGLYLGKGGIWIGPGYTRKARVFAVRS